MLQTVSWLIVSGLMNSAKSPRGADDTLGYLVLDIVRLMSDRFDGRARALGITRAQWSLIAALVRAEGSSQAQLARLMQVTPMSVGRLVDRMQRAGWVERRAEPGDRRARRLYLTEKAHALRPELRRVSELTEQEALQDLPASGRASLLAALAQVRDRLAGLPPPRRRRSGGSR